MTTPRGSTAGSASGSSTPCSAIPPTHGPTTPPTPAVRDPDRAEGRTGAEGFAGDGPRGELLLVRAGHARPSPSAGPSRTTGRSGRVPRPDSGRRRHADPTRVRDAGQAGTRRPGRRRPRRRVRRTPGRGPGRLRRPERRRPRRRRHRIRRPARGRPADTTAAPLDPGYDQPGPRAETAAAHDLPRPGAGTAGDDRDLVTSSYDPDRDTGYDPHAAGTAMGSAAGAGAGRRGRHGLRRGRRHRLRGRPAPRRGP